MPTTAGCAPKNVPPGLECEMLLLTMMHVEVDYGHTVNARVTVDMPSVRRANGLRNKGETWRGSAKETLIATSRDSRGTVVRLHLTRGAGHFRADNAARNSRLIAARPVSRVLQIKS